MFGDSTGEELTTGSKDELTDIEATRPLTTVCVHNSALVALELDIAAHEQRSEQGGGWIWQLRGPHNHQPTTQPSAPVSPSIEMLASIEDSSCNIQQIPVILKTVFQMSLI